jgi:hypothetical protein
MGGPSSKAKLSRHAARSCATSRLRRLRLFDPIDYVVADNVMDLRAARHRQQRTVQAAGR